MQLLKLEVLAGLGCATHFECSLPRALMEGNFMIYDCDSYSYDYAPVMLLYML